MTAFQENMSSMFKEPRRKGHLKQKPCSPLPVLVESETGIPAHLAVWKSFSGRFNGDCVEVCDPEDIAALYNKGYFGKGSLSRGCPRSARKTENVEIIRERQWKRRCLWTKLTTGENSSGNFSGNKDALEASKGQEVLVIADTDTEGEDFISQLQPRLETDPSSPEILNLLLEEALFLSYGLGCLYIFDVHGQKILSCSEFWTICLECDPRFLQRYVAYHHFRSKGWVVKSGLKFGGDFLLYKDGPGVYHASYVVKVEVVYGRNAIETEELAAKSMSWITLMGLNRLAETSGKEVLLCYVIWPRNLVGHASAPSVIKKFQVHEVLMHRWQPSVARINNSNQDSVKELDNTHS